ncbi:phage holin family protein [Conexibacter sp. JD483]|uniref:phage holin family protein n=1 Tax=unclassified Conexibacter TaxID=2627773 RepID=UPI002723AA7D|nr:MULTISPECIES: phage holin family protein [unclassified Conexibacter]MDO8185009.1 phage holin family protein [Conexibacter sp. CPCC 205706]MDO8198153.1 phage holin family protein [Conexibacter sp. CPCC 205762]MDR9373184.1 phage holin family protein [Conexibacter sp. JD483]
MSSIRSNGAAGPHDPTHDEQLAELPVAQLLRRLSDQASLLVREEVALAKAELAEKGKHAGRSAGMFGGAAVFGLYGVGALVTAAIVALSLAVATWLAALIVAIVLFALAGIAALAGKKQVQQATPPVPEQTVETVKEDVQWAKTRARTARQH